MIRDSTKLSVSLSTPGPVLSNLLLQSSGDSPVWWALWTIGICPSVKELLESSSEKASMSLSLLFPFFPLLVALEELLPPDDLPFPFHFFFPPAVPLLVPLVPVRNSSMPSTLTSSPLGLLGGGGEVLPFLRGETAWPVAALSCGL